MREENGHGPSLTGPCKHFFCVRVFGTVMLVAVLVVVAVLMLVAAFVAEGCAVGGDPAETYRAVTYRAVTYRARGFEGAAALGGQHPAQVAVGVAVGGDAAMRRCGEG